jgi:PHP family Zn ribbon phosphoesterase
MTMPLTSEQFDRTAAFPDSVVCDLHCHSSYAGGTGSLDLQTAISNMPLKGVRLVGTGDCLYPPWLETLRGQLIDPDDTGIFTFKKASSDLERQTKFVLQTELAITAPIGVYRKNVHCVFLFPHFQAIDETIALFDKLDVKNTIGRPFITSDSIEETAQKIHAILDLDPLIEFFPAHILVPLGIFGSQPAVTFLEDFFGDASERIHAFETGLSADPSVTSLIPQLDDLTLLSNSDAHSAALNRLGRELTSLHLPKMTFRHLSEAIRRNKVYYTAEFHPSEGRYFLTGHRGGKRTHKKDEFCVFSPDECPDSKLCPICGGELHSGVLQRAIELSELQGSSRVFGEQNGPERPFYRMVPLVEILARGLGLKSSGAKTVTELYSVIVQALGNECKLWTTPLSSLKEILPQLVDEKISQTIIEVRKGNFYFDPPGFDGTYGELKLGEPSDYTGIKIVNSDRELKTQATLDAFS